MAHPILVTGSHRSGTTWVGKIIASLPSIQYVHEPFNIDYQPNRVKPAFWFQYISRQNEGMLYEHLKKLVTPQREPSGRRGVRRKLEFINPFRVRPRVLIKDPIAVFSAEWLASRFFMDVVILVRHPAAFVCSLKEQNWTHDFSHFLQQPLLMEEHLTPFREEIREFTNRPHDLFDQAILLWKLIYFMIGKYRKDHEEWLLVRHEDLCSDPLRGFREIFGYLGLPFSEGLKQTIRTHSSPDLPVDGDVGNIKRNSGALIKKWESRLSEAEIKKIRDAVESVSKEFYTDEDW